jgi:membrane protein DedA with SNARE-associated domain
MQKGTKHLLKAGASFFQGLMICFVTSYLLGKILEIIDKRKSTTIRIVILAAIATATIAALIVVGVYYYRQKERELQYRTNINKKLGRQRMGLEPAYRGHRNIDVVLLCLSVLLLSLAIPTLFILWFTGVQSHNNTMAIFVFFVSSGIGILYYANNEDKFRTVADRVSYFVGVCLGPATAIKILF